MTDLERARAIALGLDSDSPITAAHAGITAERERILAWLDRGEPDWPWTAQDIAGFIRAGCPEITSGAGPSGVYTLDTFPDAA